MGAQNKVGLPENWSYVVVDDMYTQKGDSYITVVLVNAKATKVDDTRKFVCSVRDV